MIYLLDYAATEKQRALIHAVEKHGSVTAAARALGVDCANARRTIRHLKARAAVRGDAPASDYTRKVPAPFVLRGVSTLYDGEGGVRQQWVKSKLSPEMYQEVQEEAYKAWASELPKAGPVDPPASTAGDLLNLYVLTDFHLGMLAWPAETGEPWDLDIAERMARRWAESAIALAHDADEGLLLLLGDFLHWDGLEPVTPSNRNILDADGRFAKLVRIAIRTIRHIVSTLLTKHNRVTVIVAEGNHDMASAVWLRESMSAVYSGEPRLCIDASPDVYYAHQWGDVGIYAHHGHIRKIVSIDTVFAKRFRALWGSTKYAYAHLGHLHNERVRETNLMHITQHRTLCAKDAHASRGGWLTDREASVVTYHKRFGRIAQSYLTPDLLEN